MVCIYNNAITKVTKVVRLSHTNCTSSDALGTSYFGILYSLVIIAECFSMRHIIVRGWRQWAYCRDPHIFYIYIFLYVYIFIYICIYVRVYGKMQKYTIAC